jgi:hypothetical protein
MTSQKYFYKRQDFIQFRLAIKRFAMTIACTLVVLIFMVVLPAFALDWDDNEWASCPSTVEGTWLSENPDSINSKTLNIQKNRVSITRNMGGEVSFTGNIFLEKGNFIEMVLQSTTKEKEIYLKLRPHMVQTYSYPENSAHCMIKVFQFNSQAHAKFDKYSSWEIYQLKRN